MSLIRIAIADDYPYLVKGLKLILESIPNIKVEIESFDGYDLIEKIKTASTKPDIILLDLSMPRMNGYDALVKIKKLWPDIHVIILSIHYNEYSIIKTLRDGAAGCLPKEANVEEIFTAIKETMTKGFYHTEFVSKQMSLSLQNDMTKSKLTDKELEFLRNCCSDLSYQQIAEKMGLSSRTVEKYRDSLFHKLEVKSRPALVMFAIHSGILSIDNRK